MQLTMLVNGVESLTTKSTNPPRQYTAAWGFEQTHVATGPASLRQVLKLFLPDKHGLTVGGLARVTVRELSVDKTGALVVRGDASPIKV